LIKKHNGKTYRQYREKFTILFLSEILSWEGFMPRVSRLIVQNQTTVYHIMSRTALDGFPLEAFEKDCLLDLIKRMAGLFFTEVYGFSIMGNHFHLLAKMIPEDRFSDEEVKERLVRFYGEKRAPIVDGQLPILRQKLANLSEFIREIKVNFTRFYNKRHGRRGYFWGDRFKSLIVERGETLINCLAYIDLNPVRAGIVEKPEDYRWNSLGYHIQSGNKDGFLSTDFGLREFNVQGEKERVRLYRKYVYETGAILPGDKQYVKTIDEKVVAKERKGDFEITRTDRFLYRTRYFTDSGIIGSREFVSSTYQQFKNLFQSRHEKRPRAVKGLDGVFSLKRLSETI
jgi:putative transposase